jgi:predicted choloylglycine hydrolase
MSYTVTVLDGRGQHRTVFVGPDRPATVTRLAVATNHQRVVEWEAFAHATASLDRERYLRSHLEDTAGNPERFVQRFLEPPLHLAQCHQGWGTLYTAAYEPRTTSVALHWAGARLEQSIGHFHEAAVALSFIGTPRERMQA